MDRRRRLHGAMLRAVRERARVRLYRQVVNGVVAGTFGGCDLIAR